MKNGCWILLIVTATALLVAAQAPPAVRATGKEPGQVLHTSTLARSSTVLRGPRRALRVSGWQCCAWSQVDMFEKQGTGNRPFDRLSKNAGADAKANTAPAQAPGRAQNAKEGKEKPNIPKFYWKIERDGACGDGQGPWKDAKCTGTDVCAEVKEPQLDLKSTVATGMDKYVQFDSTSGEPKDTQDSKAVDKGASLPSQGESITPQPDEAVSSLTSGYRCQERS